MRFYALFSLAVGLVAASPCKPPSSTVVSEVISSSVTTSVSSTLIESASSTLGSTTNTAETDVADPSTAIGSTSTDYTQVSVSTTESLAEPTSTATTSETTASFDTTTALTTEASSVETTNAVTTTTTSEEAVPTGFFLVAGEGPALGGKVKSNGDSFDPMVFGDRGSTFNPARFLVDEITGELQQDGVTVCAFQQVGSPYALITRCEDRNLDTGSVPLNCAQFEGPGTSIRCSAVKLDCWPTGPGSKQACSRSMDPDWDTFFITDTGDNVWYLSSGTLQNDFMTRVEVFVDHVEVSAPVQT